MRLKLWITLTITLLLAGTAAVEPASAETIAGIEFPARVEVSGVPMELQGTGVKSVAFIKAFAAALYREPGTDLDSGGKKIVVNYFVRIPAAKLTRFTVDSMRDNVSEQRMQELSSELERMSQLFVDLKPGDRFALAYVPGEGTHFLYNGQLTGIIRGEKFAQALYSVWLGERPFDKKLKRAIMGDEQDSRFLPLFARSE